MEHSVVARAQVLDVQCFQVDLRFFELLPHFFQLCLIIHFKLNVTFFGLHHTKTKFINMSSQCHRLQSLTNTIRSVSRVSCYCCSTTSTTSGNLIPIFVCSCTQFIMQVFFKAWKTLGQTSAKYTTLLAKTCLPSDKFSNRRQNICRVVLSSKKVKRILHLTTHCYPATNEEKTAIMHQNTTVN